MSAIVWKCAQKNVRHICLSPPFYASNTSLAPPIDSFFLFETNQLEPSAICTGSVDQCEEVIQVPSGEYYDRNCWHSGFIDYDEQIPLPTNSRIIMRWLHGKIIIVNKESIWFRARDTFDGRHNCMTAKEIRGQIELAMNGTPVPETWLGT